MLVWNLSYETNYEVLLVIQSVKTDKSKAISTTMKFNSFCDLTPFF